ncbi:MAG: hypothetical protein AAGD01_18640 [Acidobacteriota bacterium]
MPHTAPSVDGSDPSRDYRNVVFVAPFFLPTTNAFIEAAASLPRVRLALVSQQPVEQLPAALRHRLVAHYRVDQALDPQQLTSAVRYLTKVLGGVDRLLGTLEQLQVPLGRVRDTLGIDGMSAETARGFRDKARMKEIFRAAGVPCARHRLVTDVSAALAFAAEVGYPLIVKPPAGAGAKATFRVQDDDALRRSFEVLRPGLGRELLLEEWVRGEESSFETLCVQGKPLWHSVCHYRPTPLEVLETPWIQWCVLLPRELDDPAWDDFRPVAFQALDALGMGTGMTHMEWFRRGDGSVAVSEVGARPPGAQITSLLSWAHDAPFKSTWARLAIFDQLWLPPRRYATGAAFLRGQGRGSRVRAIRGLDQAQRELGSLVVEAHLPKEGQTPTGTYEGEGFVILRHPETEVVEKALHRLISLVQVELG